MEEDASVGSGATADMRIGEIIIWQGRRYVVCGVDPMGVPERRADLEDQETGERVRAPVSELRPA